VDGQLSTACNRYGDTLCVAAAATASKQDAVATDLGDRSFLAPPLPLVTLPKGV